MNTTPQDQQTVTSTVSLMLMAFLFLACPTYASNYEFAAEGTIDYQVLSYDGSVFVEQVDLFTVSVKDCEWSIKKIPTRFLKNGKEQPLAEYGIASSDLTNFYEVSSFTGIVSRAEHKTESFEARIGPGAVPFGLSDPKYIVLWYAFASGCYFSSLTSDLVNPPTTLLSEEMYATDFRVPAHWERTDQAPFLPKAVAFERPPQSPMRLRGGRLIRFPGDRLLTNCLFSVQEFTNLYGLLLPKLVTARYFDWHPLNPTEIIPVGRMQLVVSNFEPRAAVQAFRPEIPGPAVVSDKRTISSNTPFGVALRNSQKWPNVEDSEKRASVRAQAIGMAEHRNKSRITFLRILLISVVIAPALWLGIQKLRARTKKPNR